MLAVHVSGLTGPSSGAFSYKLYVQIWYVVVRVYLVGLHIYYKMIHGPYNVKLNISTLKSINRFNDANSKPFSKGQSLPGTATSALHLT